MYFLILNGMARETPPMIFSIFFKMSKCRPIELSQKSDKLILAGHNWRTKSRPGPISDEPILDRTDGCRDSFAICFEACSFLVVFAWDKQSGHLVLDTEITPLTD